jgi:hypothetical protein
MDCRTARFLLDFAHPRRAELPADDADALSAHLAGCADCDTLARAERAADDRLGQAMRAVAIPEGLRSRIMDRLETDRGVRRRRTAGWVLRISAAAAIVVLAVLAGFAIFANRPRPLDLWALHDKKFAEQTTADAKKVEGWFKEDFDISTTAPTTFNYAYLTNFGIGSCQGRRVPALYFANNDTVAQVYVVSSDQFDVEALVREPEQIDSGGLHVEVRREDADHAYVVIYRGESLQPVLAQEGAAQ